MWYNSCIKFKIVEWASIGEPMQKHNAFSVLISVYNREKPEFFDVALESVYNQTIMPSEVVICEDGKLTSELDAVVDKYEKKYPKITKVVKFSENRGLGLSLRDGVLECSNEIVFRMDSDDISVEDRFEKQLGVITNKDVDVVGANTIEYNEEMNVVFGARNVPEKDLDIKRYAKRRNPINHMSVCFKKSKVVEAGNYMDMKGFEDYYLWVRMMQRGNSFYNIQEPLIKVRGGDSMVKRRGGKKYASQIKLFEKELKNTKFISLKEYYENIIMRVLSSIVPLPVRSGIYRKILRGES